MRYASLYLPLVAVAVLGCKTNPGEPFAIAPPLEWKLVPAESCLPAQTEDAVVHGSLSSVDRQQIAALVGRVEGVYPKIHEITTSFDDFVVAAKVKAGDREIYCVRDAYGHWNVVAVHQWVP